MQEQHGRNNAMRTSIDNAATQEHYGIELTVIGDSIESTIDKLKSLGIPPPEMASFERGEAKLTWLFKTEREAQQASRIFEQAFGPPSEKLEAQAPTVEV
jgi:hypothetical protein